MTVLDRLPATVAVFEHIDSFDEPELAAAAFLARCNGRTLDAYRHDLRTYFQWATDVGLGVLDATRPHIELYRKNLESRGRGGFDDRPATHDRVRLLPVRKHRRPHRQEPGPICASSPRPSERATRPGPHPTRHRGPGALRHRPRLLLTAAVRQSPRSPNAAR